MSDLDKKCDTAEVSDERENIFNGVDSHYFVPLH